MRFDRDRRGYETTALVEPAVRGRAKRLLYWFRTPPGVRVGRAPIDETAIRLLEQHNPDLEFDWTRILKAPPAAEAQGRRDARDGRDRDQRGRREPRAAQRPRSGAAPPSLQPPARPRGPEPAELRPLAAEPAEYTEQQIRAKEQADQTERQALAADHADQQIRAADPVEHADHVQAAPANHEDRRGHAAEHTEHAESAEPLRTTDQVAPLQIDPPEVFEVRPEDVGSASYVRLGAEGLVRLRARYAEVMARIAERPLEDEAREELKSRAERLNPDAWVTGNEVTAALEQYETVFEGLRGVVGRHPRRQRTRR